MPVSAFDLFKIGIGPDKETARGGLALYVVEC
jgi:hypothetical protein